MNKIGQDEDVARHRAALAAAMAAYVQRHNVRHENMLFLLAESRRELELCLMLVNARQMLLQVDVCRFVSLLVLCGYPLGAALRVA